MTADVDDATGTAARRGWRCGACGGNLDGTSDHSQEVWVDGTVYCRHRGGYAFVTVDYRDAFGSPGDDS